MQSSGPRDAEHVDSIPATVRAELTATERGHPLAAPGDPVKVGTAGRSQLLLLLLLLLVAGGAAWFLIAGPPAAPPPAVPPVVVVVPPPPQPAVPAAVAEPAARTASPLDADDGWRVAAGTYRDAAALAAAAAKLRELGYQPVVRDELRTVTLTRLRLGKFPAGEEGEAFAALRRLVPGTFALRAGASVTVYAGTYASPRNLREISALLASKGFPVEEEPVSVTQPVSHLLLGGFPGQAAATEAAARVRQAGVAAELLPPR